MNGNAPPPAYVGERIEDLVIERSRECAEKHGDFASPHEAHSVILEEVAEYFDEVRKKDHTRSKVRMMRELVDIAAAATRYAVQLAEELDHEVTVAEVRNA